MHSKLPLNLTDLLKQRTVEGARIEYKAGWNADPIMRTVCAFANDLENLGGGYVVIGQDCDSAGQPIFPPAGIPENKLDRIQQELLGYCNLIQPPYFPLLTIEEIESRKLIILQCPGGQNRPYKAPSAVTAKHKTLFYYVRRYSSTIEAKGETEQDLLSLSAKIPFDDRYSQSGSVNELSRPLIKDFLEEVGSALAESVDAMEIQALGRQMNIVGGPSESVWVKNVGLMFFNERPDKFFPGTQIDVIWFPDGPGGDQFDEKTFYGPLGQMTRDALSYIQRNYLTETVVKQEGQAEARRIWNFPFPAIEEAIVNAVYHRSYEEREPIEVRITPEEIVVLSFPGPDRAIKMEDLRAGKAVNRRYRNRRIGEFLRELDLTEGRATGIPKILRAMQNNGSAQPVFETDEERSSFVIRLARHPSTYELKKPASEGTTKVASEVVALLKVLGRGEMSRQELQDAMGLKNLKHFRLAYVLPGLASQCIEMTIPDKPSSSQQRYRATTKGLQYLRKAISDGTKANKLPPCPRGSQRGDTTGDRP